MSSVVSFVRFACLANFSASCSNMDMPTVALTARHAGLWQQLLPQLLTTGWLGAERCQAHVQLLQHLGG